MANPPVLRCLGLHSGIGQRSETSAWKQRLTAERKCNILNEPTIIGIQFACTDMLPAYLKVLKARASQALNILDRFHIMKARQMKADGYEEVLKNNLRYVKAYLMREDFNRFWSCPSATSARPGHRPASFCVSGVCARTARRSSR